MTSAAGTIVEWVMNLDGVIGSQTIWFLLGASWPSKKALHISLGGPPAYQRAEPPQIEIIRCSLDNVNRRRSQDPGAVEPER